LEGYSINWSNKSGGKDGTLLAIKNEVFDVLSVEKVVYFDKEKNTPMS